MYLLLSNSYSIANDKKEINFDDLWIDIGVKIRKKQRA